MNAVELRDIRFSYDDGATWAVDGVSLTVEAGERVCLVGPNGSGKSTLARVIAGLAAPDAGSVTLLDNQVFDDEAGAVADAYRRARRGIGVVFQHPEDQIVTTVLADDVAFGPENLGMDRDDIGRRIARSLDAVDMGAFRDADPTVMSGGQQQRVAIAGMLAMSPSMMVLDEPTAMLDPAMRAEVMRILDDLQRRGVTIVLVTHHDDETAHADRIIRMGHGRIVGEYGPGTMPDAHGHESLPQSGGDARHDGDADGAVDAGSVVNAVNADAGDGVAMGDFVDADDAVDTGDTADTDDACTAGDPGDTGGAGNATETGKPADTAAPASHATPPSGREPIITVEHLTFAYPDAAPVLDDVSFTVARGETVAVMGRNGAGKSTLARLLCALERPRSGGITIAGVRVDDADRARRRELRRHVGYVMQHPERQLFADTVAQDVAYGPTNLGLPDDEVRGRVDAALRLLHIDHLADRSPFALSGGQQRLAAIAGVIACRPDVLVMDEPTASLDAQATAIIHDLIRTLHATGMTVLIITHSTAEAAALADRVITIGADASADADMAETTPSANPAHAQHAAKTADTTGSKGSAGLVDATGSAGSSATAATTSGDGVVAGSPSPATSQSHTAPPSASPTSQQRPPSASQQPASAPHPRTAQRTWRPHHTQASSAGRRRGPLETLDPRVKMVTFLVLMFTAFAIGNARQLGLAALMTAAIVVAGRLSPKRLFSSVRVLLGMLVVMGVLNVFFARGGDTLAAIGPFELTTGGLATAALYVLRFTLVMLLGAVMLATTTPTALTDAVDSLLSPLRRFGLHTQEIALVLSLALRFLPTLAQETHAIIDAQSARGGDVETGSWGKRIRALAAIIVPVFAGTLRHADNLALALDARCYEQGVRRTHWRRMRVRARDGALMAVAAAYLVMLMALA